MRNKTITLIKPKAPQGRPQKNGNRTRNSKAEIATLNPPAVLPPPRTDADEPTAYVDIALRNPDGTPSRLAMPVDQYATYLAGLDLNELALALAKTNSAKANRFLAAIANPVNAHLDLATLARSHGYDLPETMSIWRDHKLVSAMGVWVDKSPEVALDTAIDALSTKVCCNRCDGAGTIRVNREAGQVWIDCPSCDGSGARRQPGDAKSREYIFKGTGMAKNAEPASTNVNIMLGHHSESVLDELERLPAIDVTGERS